MIWLLLSCTNGDDDVAPVDTDTDTDVVLPTSDTGIEPTPTAETGGTTPPRSACAVAKDHPLRVRCTTTLDTAGPATVTLSASGAPDRSASSEVDAVDHDLLVWALKPETTYAWDLAGEVGTVTTGALLGPLEDLTVVTTGTAFGFDAVVQSVVCQGDAYAVAIDGDGDVVWYDDLGVPLITGYDWSSEDKSFLGIYTDAFVEATWDGQHPLTLLQGTDFSAPLHHDTHRWGAYTYLLQAIEVLGSDSRPYVVDQVEVYEGNALRGTFSLDQVYDPATIPGEDKDGFWEGLFPGATDWSHGNAITVDDGEMVLSLRWLDSAIGVDGDPDSPTFGQILWVAVGSSLSLPNPTYAPIVGPDEGFDGQHHVSRVGDDLWLFDNRAAAVPSRAARYRLDDVSQTLTLDGAWSFDYDCPIHGGAYPLDGGGALATCATRAEVFAFAETSTEPDWTMSATCNAVSQTLKGIPIRYD